MLFINNFTKNNHKRRNDFRKKFFMQLKSTLVINTNTDNEFNTMWRKLTGFWGRILPHGDKMKMKIWNRYGV